MSAPVDWITLMAAATAVQQNAHAPYSQYRVGAALITAAGKIFAGCNVENASYGLTICAERNAVVQMIAAGERTPVAIAVVTPGPEVGPPCGSCRQTLAEFATDLPIALGLATQPTPVRVTSLLQLFPEPFRADLVKS